MRKFILKRGTLKLLVLLFILTALSFQSSYGHTDQSIQITDTAENKIDTKTWDRFSLSLGYFFSGENSGIMLGSQQLGIGLVIDLEDALALKTNTIVFRGIISYTFAKTNKHNIIVDYFSINRSAIKILGKDIEIGDEVYPIGTQVDSKLYFSIVRAKYNYSFFQDKRVSLGSSIGLFIMPLTFSAKANGLKSQSTKLVAPLPVLGLRFTFAVTPKLFLKQEADVLYLKVDNFTGSIVDLNFAIEHKTFKHFGFGLGVNSNKLQIRAAGKNYPNINFFGDLRMEYTGLKLYASYFF